MEISRKDIEYLFRIVNFSISDKEKASLIIDYILDNKIDIVSYGKKDLLEEDRIKFEELLNKLLYLNNCGYYDSVVLDYVRGDYIYFSDFLRSKNISIDKFNYCLDYVRFYNPTLYKKYISKRRLNNNIILDLLNEYNAVYFIINSEGNINDKIILLVSLGINSSIFKERFYSLFLHVNLDDIPDKYKDHLNKYSYLLSVLEKYNEKGYFMCSSITSNYADYVILFYIKSEYISIDDFIKSFDIDSDTFRNYLRKVKDKNSVLYSSFLMKKSINTSISIFSAKLKKRFKFSNLQISNFIDKLNSLNCSFDNLYDELNDIVDYFKSYGFNINVIRNIIKNNIGVILKSKFEISNTIKILESLGYNKDEVISICDNNPLIFDCSNNFILYIINYLTSLGCSKDVIKNILLNNCISNLNIDRINNFIDCFSEFNYNKEEIMNIISVCPSLLSKSLDKVRFRLKFYRDYGLDNLIIDSNNFDKFDMDISIIYARVMFFYENGIDINLSNINFLLSNNLEFNKRYKVSIPLLCKRYPFNSSISHSNIKRVREYKD